MQHNRGIVEFLTRRAAYFAAMGNYCRAAEYERLAEKFGREVD